MKAFKDIIQSRLMFWGLAVAVTTVLAGCRSQSATVKDSYADIEATQLTLYDDKATTWASQHIGELINEYIESAGNKLDPDEIRKLFMPIGYDGGTNTPRYRAAEKVLVDTIYKVMMKRAIDMGQPSIVILTGPSASGKTTATKHMDFSKTGLVYDGALNKYEKLAAVIDKACQTGMKDVTVIALYNTIRNCFRNSISRGLATNRFIDVVYMINSYEGNQGKMAKIMANYPDVKVMPIDKQHNINGSNVSTDECKNWDFHVSQEDISVLFAYIWDEIETGRLKPNQLAAIAGDITSIPGLNAENKALAEEIDRRIHESKNTR